MNINEQAPAKTTQQLHIDAPLGVVWALLADIDNWPSWNPSVSRAKLDGTLAPGSVFRWKSGGSSIVSTLREVEPPHRLVWTGRALGVTGVHTWDIKSGGPGVMVTTSESFDGFLVRVFRPVFQRILDTANDQALRALRAAAEQTSAVV